MSIEYYELWDSPAHGSPYIVVLVMEWSECLVALFGNYNLLGNWRVAQKNVLVSRFRDIAPIRWNFYLLERTMEPSRFAPSTKSSVEIWFQILNGTLCAHLLVIILCLLYHICTFSFFKFPVWFRILWFFSERRNFTQITKPIRHEYKPDMSSNAR